MRLMFLFHRSGFPLRDFIIESAQLAHILLMRFGAHLVNVLIASWRPFATAARPIIGAYCFQDFFPFLPRLLQFMREGDFNAMYPGAGARLTVRISG